MKGGGVKLLNDAKKSHDKVQRHDAIKKPIKNSAKDAFKNVKALAPLTKKMSKKDLQDKKKLTTVGKLLVRANNSMTNMERKVIKLGDQLEKKKNPGMEQVGGYYTITGFFSNILGYFYWCIRTFFNNFFTLLGRDFCMILAMVFIGSPIITLTGGVGLIPVVGTTLVVREIGFFTLMLNDMLKNGMSKRTGASILSAAKIKQQTIKRSKGRLSDNTVINFMEMKAYSNKWGVLTSKQNSKDGMFKLLYTKLMEFKKLTAKQDTLFERNISTKMHLVLLFGFIAIFTGGIAVPLMRYQMYKSLDQIVGYQAAQYIDDKKYPQFREEFLNCIITVWGGRGSCDTFELMVHDVKKMHRSGRPDLFKGYPKPDKFGLVENDWLLLFGVDV